ncbi:hypothetical protein MMC12_001803 [Toensbergia leucococca]|nr:hypothetical protein [Toensbergia leucococca]
MPPNKAEVREKVWAALARVARPDSRFHLNFAEFIPDFEGSSSAIAQFVCLPCYISATVIFVTPDNCLEGLRLAALKDGKSVLTTTYAIRRGFWLLEPVLIPPARYEYAATLDGQEKLARPIELSQVLAENLKIDLLVTGTGAISTEGVRVGKGHGFFDLEWGMLYSVRAITVATPAAVIVHDCQIVTDKVLPEEYDTVCDIVVTPTRIIEVSGTRKPVCGILWDKLAEGMLEGMPALQELKGLNSSEWVSLQTMRS